MNIHEIFYGELRNKEGLMTPAYKQKGQYPLYRPVSNYGELCRFLRRKTKIPYDSYVSAYEYDTNFMIDDWHKTNNNYRFKKVLKPAAERLLYPYKDHVIFDRLFLDFDTELLDSDKAYLKQKDVSLKEKQEYLVEKIEHRKLLRKPLEQAKQLGKEFQGIGLKPIYLFSGKGIHLYVLFPKLKVRHSSFVLKEFYKTLEIKKTFTTLDSAVFEPARKSRVVLSQNTKTGLFVIPINPDDSVENILESARKPEPSVDIDLTGNNGKEIHKVLKTYDSKAESLIQQKKELMVLKPTRGPRLIRNSGDSIQRGVDSIKLLQFPCFQNMQMTYDDMLMLMSILSFTGLESAEQIMDGVLEFCKAKGISKERSNGMLDKINLIKGKYSYGSKHMSTCGYCNGCAWDKCWKNVISFKPEYYQY